jgi:hypothetical protein
MFVCVCFYVYVCVCVRVLCRDLLNELYLLDTLTGQLSIVATLGPKPSPRSGASLTVCGGGAWVVGGYDGGGYLGDAHRLDLETLRWGAPGDDEWGSAEAAGRQGGLPGRLQGHPAGRLARDSVAAGDYARDSAAGSAAAAVPGRMSGSVARADAGARGPAAAADEDAGGPIVHCGDRLIARSAHVCVAAPPFLLVYVPGGKEKKKQRKKKKSRPTQSASFPGILHSDFFAHIFHTKNRRWAPF